MSSALNSVFGGGNILGAALNIASMVYPPLGLATSLGNMLTQGVGQAVNQAAQQLMKECGMPKFLGSMIGDLVKDVIKDLCQPSQPQCDQAAGQNFGSDIGDIIKDLTKTIFENAKALMEQDKGDGKGCKGGKGKGGGKEAGGAGGGGSWLEAIATAMGQAAGNKASKMVELSQKLKELSSADGDEKAQAAAAKEMNVVNAQFQAASQEFNILQSAFSNSIKALGEGMSQMARKG